MNTNDFKDNAFGAIKRKDFPGAEKICRDAAATLGDGKAESTLARTLRLQGRMIEASATYIDAMRKYGKNPFYLTGLAAVYKDMGRLSEAVDLCKEALGMSPGSAHAGRTLASVYIKMGEREKATNYLHLFKKREKLPEPPRLPGL